MKGILNPCLFGFGMLTLLLTGAPTFAFVGFKEGDVDKRCKNEFLNMV